jgi:hypothetical protein
MKKVLATLCLLFMGMVTWAQTCGSCAVSLQADTVNGSGVLNGQILDLTGVVAGSTVCIDLVLEDFDFNLAGYQFQINYPSNLLALSTTDADWQNGTGFVAIPGEFMTTGNGGGAYPMQQLPADTGGSLTGATAVQNGEGRKPLGFLLTDPSQRPAGSSGTPNAGGSIAKICFELNPSGLATCTSFQESFSINLAAVFNGVSDDIFANENAERVVVGTSAITLVWQDTNAGFVRCDANKDGNRNQLDALAGALCSLNGQGSCAGWGGNTADEFRQSFDHNCDGNVNALDALPNARKCLGLQNRTSFKNANYMAVSEAGMMTLDYETQRGAMAFAEFQFDGVGVNAPFINEEAQKAGWNMFHLRDGNAMQIMVINLSGENKAYPAVHFNYEPVSKNARIGLMDTAHQTADLNTFAYVPVVNTQNVMEHGANLGEDARRK